MEVVYKSILDEISEIRYKADVAHRTIRHIKLTRYEWRELVAELAKLPGRVNIPMDLEDDTLGMYDGVTLTKGWKY